jgi:hypothetical protein
MRSNCCSAPVLFVINNRKKYYECEQCGKQCDVKRERLGKLFTASAKKAKRAWEEEDEHKEDLLNRILLRKIRYQDENNERMKQPYEWDSIRIAVGWTMLWFGLGILFVLFIW